MVSTSREYWFILGIASLALVCRSALLATRILWEETRRSDGLTNDRFPPSIFQNKSDSSVSVALCHKTLFGNVNFELIQEWATYYRLLGVDHVFIWYYPDEYTASKEFERLASLPYLTMVKNPRPNMGSNYIPDYQIKAERWCLEEQAKHYDWVLIADADEYLWFDRSFLPDSRAKVPNSLLKEFLLRQSAFNYLSFGKYMYSVADKAIGLSESTQDFALEQFPFTTGPFCHVKGVPINASRDLYRGSDFCPGFAGRAKVMVRPKYHSTVGIHGKYIRNLPPGARHFSTVEAHMKEWPGMYETHNVTTHPARDFSFRHRPRLPIHQLRTSHPVNPDGTFQMYFDSQLQDWFASIKGGF